MSRTDLAALAAGCVLGLLLAYRLMMRGIHP